MCTYCPVCAKLETTELTELRAQGNTVIVNRLAN